MNDYSFLSTFVKLSLKQKRKYLFICISKYVLRKVLDKTYKLYNRPHLNYGDIIYHNQRADLMHLVEQTRYKAALIVLGCRQGISREKIYKELGCESISDRMWFHRLTIFYKKIIGHLPLCQIIYQEEGK